MFGTSFGLQQQPQPQVQQLAQQLAPAQQHFQIHKGLKYNELPKEMQQKLNELQNIVQQTGNQGKSVQVNDVEKMFESVEESMRSCFSLLKLVKMQMSKSKANLVRQNVSLTTLVSTFDKSAVSKDLDYGVQYFQQQINECELIFATIEERLQRMTQSRHDNPLHIINVLKNECSLIGTMAKRVLDLQDLIKRLKPTTRFAEERNQMNLNDVAMHVTVSRQSNGATTLNAPISTPLSSNLFSSQNTSLTPKPTPSMFASNLPQSGMFGSTQPQQPQTGMFGSTQQQPQTGMFGSTQQQPQTGMFGSTQQQPQTGMFGSTQQQQPQTGMFGTGQAKFGFGQ